MWVMAASSSTAVSKYQRRIWVLPVIGPTLRRTSRLARYDFLFVFYNDTAVGPDGTVKFSRIVIPTTSLC